MSELVELERVRILLVDDSEVDALFTREAFSEVYPRVELTVARDGVEALETLRYKLESEPKSVPNIVILDLNMPRKDGRATLLDIKSDPDLRSLPVIVLTTSSDPEDILNAYQGYANSYITKPVDFQGYTNVVSRIRDFWLDFAKLP